LVFSSLARVFLHLSLNSFSSLHLHHFSFSFVDKEQQLFFFFFFEQQRHGQGWRGGGDGRGNPAWATAEQQRLENKPRGSVRAADLGLAWRSGDGDIDGGTGLGDGWAWRLSSILFFFADKGRDGGAGKKIGEGLKSELVGVMCGAGLGLSLAADWAAMRS
jgi:hypothetical protein